MAYMAILTNEQNIELTSMEYPFSTIVVCTLQMSRTAPVMKPRRVLPKVLPRVLPNEHWKYH